MIFACLQEALRHHQAGRLDQAEGLYRRVLSVDPLQPDALHLFGMAALARGRFDEAHRLVTQSVELKPAEAIFVSDLGVVLESLGRFREAESTYRRALELNPLHAESLNNLGNMHRAAWRPTDAANAYRAALAIKPDFAMARGNLGNTFADQQKFDEAIACYREALALDGRFLDARKNLAIALADQGHYKQAEDELQRVREQSPLDSGVKIRQALLLPVFPESADAIDQRRQRLDGDLDRLLEDDLRVRDPLAETPGPAFYLTYHGRNDVAVQRKIASVYRHAVPSLEFTAPHCRAARVSGQSPIRVGLISRFFYRHSVADHFAGLIRAFPREQARYTVLRVTGPEDDVSSAIDGAADKVVRISTRLGEAREQVAAEELDVLLYTDIGMDPWTYFLAFSRLAPVQCATVGQPGTTGISTVDYFLSSDRLEPSDGQSHYSEQLVRLSDIPHYFERPTAPDESSGRTGIPLPAEARWYVCQQTLFKIHPEFDLLMGQILRRDPLGIVVLFEGQVPTWKALLLNRLQRSIPDVVDRIVFLPRLARPDYLRLLTQADVVLDTIHYGAGTTAMHALALASPLVTLPGKFNRGRVAYALLQKLGISELIATSPIDYVERAIRIAQDPSLRKSLCTKILERCGVLFSNPAPAAQLEAFFVEAVRGHSACQA
ncbi:MAG TPA: tetratricopeptide repeat protein [Planctomycetaceae bacterium]|nr:tetratricopeptide repeat protein [Planctomycetaceae bacterium]